MLDWIYSEKLKTKSRPDGTIHFHKGLNVILGSRDGTTSIGKSTSLLLIDYAFGGDSYLKTDAIKTLGEHEIQFSFLFKNERYIFSRSTNESKEVIRLDNSKNPIRVYSKAEFITLLATEYGLSLPGISFRNTVSRFFRIYPKNNYTESHPLQMNSGMESQEKAISVLIALFGFYQDISTLKIQLTECSNRIKAFKDARKYEFIPSMVNGEKRYRENEAEISTLLHKLEILKANSGQTVIPEDIEYDAQRHDLLFKIRDIQKELHKKEAEIKLLEDNLHYGALPTEADIHSLLEFFPNANTTKIMDIEKFHNKIQFILHEELEATISSAKEELKTIKKSFSSLTEQLSEIPVSPVFSDDFLQTYTALDRKIHKLQEENSTYKSMQELKNEKEKLSNRLTQHTELLLRDIQSKINFMLEKISDEVSDSKDTPPMLHLRSANSYDFSTEDDEGTGTRYKGMLYYDLSILYLTPLPAIAHDSLLFANLSDQNIRKILMLYAEEKEKQIFIAFDRYENYGNAIKELLQTNCVLKLSGREQALFGRQWALRDDSKVDIH